LLDLRLGWINAFRRPARDDRMGRRGLVGAHLEPGGPNDSRLHDRGAVERSCAEGVIVSQRPELIMWVCTMAKDGGLAVSRKESGALNDVRHLAAEVARRGEESRQILLIRNQVRQAGCELRRATESA